MLTQLSQQITQFLPYQKHFLIGLSGGVDSVVLLHLFTQIPHLRLRAVHIHHGLSPNADYWAGFCYHFCQQLAIPFIQKKVSVQGNLGLEGNARQARYQAIGEIVQTDEVFVTAHHLDDQAESFFLALKRGSGIQGLSAMQTLSQWQHFSIFRPLLEISKAEILHYAESQQLTWINDESNENDRFDRNFLRNQILPELNARFAQFSQMVARSAQHCAQQQQLIEELLAEELKPRSKKQGQFELDGFEQFSTIKQQQLIRLWLAQNQFMMPSLAQLQAVISELIFAKKDKNPQIKLGDKILRRYQQKLFITAETALEPLQEIILAVPENREQIAITNKIGKFLRTQNKLIFCKKSGETYRLQIPSELQNQTLIMKFQVGGKVKQYGKPHREEMKKIWQKNNIPPWDRNSTPLIFFNDELVAVIS